MTATASEASALAATIAAVALLLKLLPPVIDALKGQTTSSANSADMIRREAEARMILNSVSDLLKEQTDVLRDVLVGVHGVKDAIVVHDEHATSLANSITLEIRKGK